MTEAQCRRPSRGELTKEELKGLHKAKMMGKYFRNLEPGRVNCPQPFDVKRLEYLRRRLTKLNAKGEARRRKDIKSEIASLVARTKGVY